MLGPGSVQVFARKAQRAKAPAGLFGIFGDENECRTLWRYLEVYAETCDDVTFNPVQQEVTFPNGARVRVFIANWRLHIGLRFEDVLLCDESIRDLVCSMINRKSGKVAVPEETPKPVFGL